MTAASLTLEFDDPVQVSHLLLREHTPLGQRVEKWNAEAFVDGQWQPLAQATTIGIRRILRFEPVTTRRIRVNIQEARACPVLSTVSLY